MILMIHIKRTKNYRVSPETSCWDWLGGVNNKGYGPHRRFYQRLVGPIPTGMQVCHHCDNRRCVNPDHLFVGTNSDNVRDMVRKGRQVIPDRRGERHPRAKLTKQQVDEIRERYRAGEGQTALAREFGVQQPAIWKIVTRRTWSGAL